MATEIERKFLLDGEAWRPLAVRSQRMEQGYLVDAAAMEGGFARCSVRVRIAGESAWLNVKSARLGIERAEYEYALPLPDAKAMLRDLCRGRVAKTRHFVPVDAYTFEIDEFEGENQGLIVAEVELERVDAEVPRPAWLGREVSHLARYYNVHLIAHPYARWSTRERAGEED
ncbi:MULTISPECIES: CYTH domain-containing protein [Oleiagrimonas]|jgi:adenylate cyclase|uniref:CYTH domain-containing protein n=1 Tax=Oleiagrimonas citrea TaxID=1665687 RepID=A0A846ZP01_9GAMM|nr:MULTISPECIES: CYTH domain-containing protein [Oleiagrimonas]NKZ39173.1 CYTH domain-containing protein [Oleiagrimonas citrea]RAP57773.1 CYTH domain protein [Oleiagrimonas sp. MCCC 1A03011]